VHFTVYGNVRADTQEEADRGHRAMMARTCPVCGSKPGKLCKRPEMGKRMELGVVHMGRLPDGFDLAKAMMGEYES
jgi:hypothetical protein